MNTMSGRIAAIVAIAALCSACAGTGITVAQPDVAIHPPPELMSPPVAPAPVLWLNKGLPPANDVDLAVAPVPRDVPTAKIVTPPVAVPAQPPKVLIPPATVQPVVVPVPPPVAGPRETGKAPVPAGPVR